MAGLTAAGLEIKRLADLQVDTAAGFKATFGPNTRTGPDSVLGQVSGVFNAELELVWQLAQQLYDGQNRNAAEGTQLDNIGNLVGVPRLGATFSTGEITATGTAGTVIPIGTVVENSGTGDRFETLAVAVIEAGGNVTIAIQGTETGELVALTGEIDEIVNPIAGFDSVTNPADIDPGRGREADADYRIRQIASLQATGAGVDIAIRAAVAGLAYVDSVRVISNRTGATVNGIPKHAFETVVYPDPVDTDQRDEIAETVFRRQPAGIQAFGTTSFTVTDDQGYAQTVGITFATEVNYFIEADITKNTTYPADGDAQVEAALLAEGDAAGVGDDVKIWKFIAALDDIPGINDVTIRIDTANPAVNTANISIANDTIAIFDSARITVTS